MNKVNPVNFIYGNDGGKVMISNNQTANKIIRQGDILFRQVNKPVEEGCEVLPNSKTVALGELTGHHHSFGGNDQMLVFKDKKARNNNEPVAIQVLAPAELTHQEHFAIQFEPGYYKIVREQEYNPMTKQLQRAVD